MRHEMYFGPLQADLRWLVLGVDIASLLQVEPPHLD